MVSINNIKAESPAEDPVRVKIIKPRIGKICICPVCHMRQPFKKRKVILKLLKMLTLITLSFLKFILYTPNA